MSASAARRASRARPCARAGALVSACSRDEESAPRGDARAATPRRERVRVAARSAADARRPRAAAPRAWCGSRRGRSSRARPRIARRASPTRRWPASRSSSRGFYIDVFAYPNEAGAIPTTSVTRDEARALCAAQGQAPLHRARVGARVQGPEQHDLRVRRRVPRRRCTTGRAGEARAERAARRLQERLRRARHARRRVGVDGERLGARGRLADRRRARRQRRRGRARRALRERHGVAPASRRADLGVRCCAGEPNHVRGDALGHARQAARAARRRRRCSRVARRRGPRESAFRACRATSRFASTACGSGIRSATKSSSSRRVLEATPATSRAAWAYFDERSTRGGSRAPTPALVGFASSGWWMAVVKTDHRDRDLWVFGGDGNSSFRRRVRTCGEESPWASQSAQTNDDGLAFIG